MQRLIYLDNAATTATRPEVVEAMLPYFTEYYGNPSTIYSLGQQSHMAVDAARKILADSLGAAPEEIYFTAGGSEADNWAIKAWLPKPTRAKGGISSRARSSITLCCIPASTSRKTAMKSHTWMWMNTAAFRSLSSKPQFVRIPFSSPSCLPTTRSAP